MKFAPIKIDFYENKGTEFTLIHDVININAGVKIIDSTILGPLYLNRFTQVGPRAVVGKYSGLNESCFFARGEMGAYCAIGARTSINPFNHPISWLSMHEFQYHPKSYDWVAEYKELERLQRTPDMFESCRIGNDVWMGHNVNVLAGVSIGDGAVIAAGSVVTKDVPPYGIVAGVPATVRKLRFAEPIVERLLKVQWWDFELSELSGLNFRVLEECLPRLEDMRAAKSDKDKQASGR